MTRIVASLVEGSLKGVSRSSRRAFSQGADVVEVRLDHLRLSSLDDDTVSKVRECVRGPAIATLRSSCEGGESALTGRARERTITSVLKAGFEYVDLELRQDSRLLGKAKGSRGPETIVSVHFHEPTSRGQVMKALSRACDAGSIGKVAMHCEHAGHALMLADVGIGFSEGGRRFAVMGMGEQGTLTRVCAGRIGSALVYSCLKGRSAAPGQLDVHTQSALGIEDKVVLGLLGHPVAHSVSKPMQEAALRRAGIEGAYLNLDLPPKELTRASLESLSRLGFSGLNVTIPHKLRARELCDSVDSEAASVGAVNTIVFRNGRVLGKNTDVIGFIKAVEQKTRIGPETRTLVVGAGGAARAAVFALAREGAHVTVAARNPKRTSELAEEFGAEHIALRDLARSDASYDLIVNSTPLGTSGTGAAPVPLRLFGPRVLFFDMVYNPPVTSTMKAAASRKATAVGGLDMLVGQGAESFSAWTGRTPDTAAMKAAARRALR
jgi:shikimate dehydrogenase/3-dehydroquinate dehydratase type I